MDTDADYPALLMANYLFGSGGSSRLWKRIRESDGLSYDVRSGVDWNADEPNSSWTVSAIFAPQNQPKVEAALREELALSIKDGFTQKELDEARAGLLNLRRLSRAQDGNVASQLASDQRLGRTFAFAQRVDQAIEKLTPRAGQCRLAQVHRSGAGRARLGRRLQGGAVRRRGPG